MNLRRAILAGASALTALALTPSLVVAQDYPSRPIRIVSPSPAGGAGDLALRQIAEHLSKDLNQSVIIENKLGANGMVAAEEALRGAADGYTLYAGSNTTLVANPFLFKTVRYDAAKDFTPITLTGLLPFLLVVNPELPVNSVSELIEYIKERPGKVSFASANATSLVAGSMFARMAELDVVNVPYQSAPASLIDIVGGRVEMTFVDIASSKALIESGKLKLLAVTSPKRLELMPEVPTVDEAGLPDYQLVGWTAIVAPTGTDPAIIKRLNATLTNILGREDVKTTFGTAGIEATGSTPEELGTFMQAERPRWGRLIKEAGIEPQ